MDPITVSAIISGIAALASAIPKMIPDKERRERIDELKDLKKTGLSKEEESEMAALMAASDASQNKAILATIQESTAGSGQISGADMITSQKVAQEQAAKASQRRGLVISQADQAAKDAAERELAILQGRESQFIAQRNQSIGDTIGELGQIGAKYYDQTQTPNVYNDADLQAARSPSIQAESPSIPNVTQLAPQTGTMNYHQELAALGYSDTALDLYQGYTLRMSPEEAYNRMIERGVQ